MRRFEYTKLALFTVAIIILSGYTLTAQIITGAQQTNK